MKLTGTVKDVSTQLGIDDSVAEIFTLAGDRVAGCTVVSTGDFTCRQALPAGTYYAASSNYAGYIDELYRTPRTPCVGGGEFCDIAQGTPIVMTLGETPDPIHLTLDRGGWAGAMKSSGRQYWSLLQHEMVHLVIGEAETRQGVNFPRWLSEGVATFISGEMDLSRLLHLSWAQVTRRSISLDTLTVRFPEDPAMAEAAYAQSFLFVQYLMR